MDRETGLRRTTALTLALIAAGLAGSGAVAAAAASAQSATQDDAAPQPVQSPTITSGDDEAGQATSGGS